MQAPLEVTMAIQSILDLQLDDRHYGDNCFFNGYLEDYLSLEDLELDSVLKDAFTTIHHDQPQVKICVGLKDEISKDAISNQIIRYKDIFKLSGKALLYPYILYTSRDNEDRALLVVPYEPYSYLYAKGFYYCMTEPGSLFIDCKNEIVAISTKDPSRIVTAFNNLFEKKAGALQRAIDHEYFTNYEELQEQALKAAEDLVERAKVELLEVEDRTAKIYQYIIRWFLLKKDLYVQYMVNKDILNNVHEGNVKKQRNQAKLNADQVLFLSYSDMYRLGKDTEGKVDENQSKKG